MIKKLTVFTPTFNRAGLLPKLYWSLCSQTQKDFIWLIIDDGSSDGTRALVQKWISQNKIEINYHFKKNGGMHTGHNAAYRLIETELNVCIDSDDYMPTNAVEVILKTWDSITDKTRIAGIIGLDIDINGNVIGSKIPKTTERGSLQDLYKKYKVTGDKKLVLRSDIVRKYSSYPEYKNEKLVPLGILYLAIGKDYDFHYSNEIFCIVEYQNEGSSNTILRQYKKSPLGFAYARTVQIKFAISWKDLFMAYMHLVSSSIFAKDFSLLWKSVNPLMSLLAFPFGVVLNIWIRIKA